MDDCPAGDKRLNGMLGQTYYAVDDFGTAQVFSFKLFTVNMPLLVIFYLFL